MGTSKFKNVIQNIFKNYSSLLVPAAIGLVAVLLFIPTELMSSKLRQQIEDESISKRGKKIQRLSKGVVARDEYRKEQRYQRAYKNDANEISLLVRQSSQRELLSYKIFPEPRDASALIFEEFGRRFRGTVDTLLARVNGRDCPTDVELQRGLEGLSKLRSRADRQWSGRRTSGSRLSQARATIEDVLCREKAEAACVYANPTDLSGYEFWKEYEVASWADTIKDCWYWQLGYWIIEDVIDTIGALNVGSENVFSSPVKRLVSVSFPASSKDLRIRVKSGQKATDDKPKYVFSVEDVLTRPCTGRYSDDDVDIDVADIDVVHFNVVVVVSTKAILPFMRQLCSGKEHKFRGWDGEQQEQVFKHNQITILEDRIVPINLDAAEHRRYRYGDESVVWLDLICEYVFNKAGYDEVKPEPVKESVKEVVKKLEEKKTKAKRKRSIRETREATDKTKLGKKSKLKRREIQMP